MGCNELDRVFMDSEWVLPGVSRFNVGLDGFPWDVRVLMGRHQ